MATKKNFTKADGAVDKFFAQQQSEETEQNTNTDRDAKYTNIANITEHTNHINDTNISKSTNRSKHYHERGKRAERFGLLLDEQLKEDLKHLSMAKGNKSVNDFVVTILLEYVEREENQKKLEQYRKLLQE